jgi:hypothetical protein
MPTNRFVSIRRASWLNLRAIVQLTIALSTCWLLTVDNCVAVAQSPQAAPRATILPVVAQAAAAGSGAVAGVALQAQAPNSAAQKGGGGTHEGIKVHGHWVIDVKNPDGSLAAHRDFENSIFYDGNQLLTDILVGAIVPAGLNLLLCDLSAGSNPTSASCNGTSVFFEEPGSGVASKCTAAGLCFPVLSEPLPLGGPLTVTGTATLPQPLPSNVSAITINAVYSLVAACLTSTTTGGQATYVAPNSAYTPASCFAATTGDSYFFTGASIAPVTVSGGQSVTVTFNLSFS